MTESTSLYCGVKGARNRRAHRRQFPPHMSQVGSDKTELTPTYGSICRILRPNSPIDASSIRILAANSGAEGFSRFSLRTPRGKLRAGFGWSYWARVRIA
jgi:hypothetical protein